MRRSTAVVRRHASWHRAFVGDVFGDMPLSHVRAVAPAPPGMYWKGGGTPPPPRDLLEFSFRRGGGDPSPLDPLPPSPFSSSAAENLGFGNFFW